MIRYISCSYTLYHTNIYILQLNAFFRYLDYFHNKNPSTKKRRSFVEEIVEKALDNTIRVLKKVPQWGIRMESVEEVSGDSLEL